MIGPFSAMAARTKIERARDEIGTIADALFNNNRYGSTMGTRKEIGRRLNSAKAQLRTATMILDEQLADEVKLSVWAVKHVLTGGVESLWLDETEAQKRCDQVSLQRAAFEGIDVADGHWFTVKQVEVNREWREAADAAPQK